MPLCFDSEDHTFETLKRFYIFCLSNTKSNTNVTLNTTVTHGINGSIISDFLLIGFEFFFVEATNIKWQKNMLVMYSEVQQKVNNIEWRLSFVHFLSNILLLS